MSETEVELTNDAYVRWLRAQRPQPIAWFLSFSELEQEALARLGDDYVDGCIELGTSAGQEADGASMEQIAAAAIRERLAGSGSPQTKPAPTMGGLTKQREERAQAEQAARSEGRTLFGKKPDSVQTENDIIEEKIAGAWEDGIPPETEEAAG